MGKEPFGIGVSVACLALIAAALSQDLVAADNAQWVDPYIGTDNGGDCFPGPSWPFGFAQPSPDSDADVPKWNNPSLFRYSGQFIYGFSQTHISGTGVPDLGDVRLMPLTAANRPGVRRDDGFRSAWSPSNTVCEVGYYAVRLDTGAFAEMTAAPHTSFLRFSWPEGSKARLLVDLQWGAGSNEKRLREHLGAHVSHLDAKAARVTGTNKGWQWVYREASYCIQFSQPWTAVEELPLLPLEKAPRRIFTFDLKPGEKLGVKVGLSTIDPEGAAKNLESEIPDWDFGKPRKACRAAWNEILGRVEIGGDAKAKAIYYTGLYHLCLQPSNIADVDGRYRGLPREGSKRWRDKPVCVAESGKMYSTFSIWDTYRAASPYLTILVPERVPEMINSLLDQENACGYLPIWPLWGGETGCMIANHAVVEIADACLKDIPGVNWERAYAAVKRTMTRPKVGKMNTDWKAYDKYGYFPFDLDPKERYTVSRTLETCADDLAAAKMAAKLGYASDAAFFRNRSKAWTNLWDKSTRFFRGRDAKGTWREPFHVLAHGWWRSKDGVDYCEANAWQYRFHMQQEPEGLIAALGGREAFLKEFDLFFGDARELDGTKPKYPQKFGQYGHDNEPSHHMAYFAAVAGDPVRTQDLVRRIAAAEYKTGSCGIRGNDDCGQMSAWYLFSALGFYPFDPCGGEYVLGIPLVPRASIRVKGKTFTVVAKDFSEKNVRVRRVTLNGKPVTDGKIRHADILSGGELVFEMGAAGCPDPEG